MRLTTTSSIILFAICSLQAFAGTGIKSIHNESAALAKPMKEGIARFEAGDFAGARKQLGKLTEGDPSFESAQGLRALCLYGLKEDKRFLKQVELIDRMTTMTLEPRIEEEIGWKYVEASHRINAFDKVIAAESEFETAFPDSPKLAELKEYKTNALFKRGRKAAGEAAFIADENKSMRRKDTARLELLEFMGLALENQAAGYRTVKNENLKEQITEAKFILGDETTMLADMPGLSAADQQKLAFVRTQVHLRLHPKAIDENIGLLEDFVLHFPKARQVNRVYIDLESLIFKRAESLHREATLATHSPGPTKAKLDAAHADFERLRLLMDGIEIDKTVGVAESDIMDMHKDWLLGYWLEQDRTGAYDLALRIVQNNPKGSLLWGQGKLNEGMGLYYLEPQEPERAIACFDAAMSLGLRKNKLYDGLYTAAAGWRISMARLAGDDTTEETIKTGISKNSCDTEVFEFFVATPDYNRQAKGIY